MPPKKAAPNPVAAHETLPLPPEVLTQIFLILLETHRPTLTSCCLVSRSFASFAGPVLYSRINISPYEKIDSRQDHSPNKLTPKGNEKRSTRKKRLLHHARVVQLDAHHSTFCKNKSMSCSKLDVLTLRLRLNALGPVLHEGLSESQCFFLKGNNVRPKKLVLDGCSMTSLQPFPIGFAYGIYDHVEELVFICPSVPIIPSACQGPFPPMKKLKRVTWMFYTPAPGALWKLGSPLDPTTGQPTQIQRNGRFTAELKSLGGLISCLPPSVPISIVNSGSLDPSLFRTTIKVNTTAQVYSDIEVASNDPAHPWDYKATQDRFAHDLKEFMIKEGGPQKIGLGNTPKYIEKAAKDIASEKVEKRFEDISFVGMKEYLERYGWVGELEFEEAQKWLNYKKQAG